jgi:hypothetical protein
LRERIIHFLARMPAGTLLGVGTGLLYAGLVSAVQLGVSRSWDRGPVRAVTWVAAGGLFLLLLGIASFLAGETIPDSSPPPAAHTPVSTGNQVGKSGSRGRDIAGARGQLAAGAALLRSTKSEIHSTTLLVEGPRG